MSRTDVMLLGMILVVIIATWYVMYSILFSGRYARQAEFDLMIERLRQQTAREREEFLRPGGPKPDPGVRSKAHLRLVSSR